MTTWITWLNAHSGLSEWMLLVVAILTAAIAIWQILAARKVQDEQARPYVAVDIRRVTGGIVELYVRNFGSTAAHDVTLLFSPAPASVSNPEHFELFKALPTLVPGGEWSTIWETQAWKRFQESEAPTRFDVVVTYAGSRNARSRQRYKDPFVIDWRPYKDTTYVVRKDSHDVAQALEKIYRELSQARRQLGKISTAIGTDVPGQHTLVEAGDALAQCARSGTEAEPSARPERCRWSLREGLAHIKRLLRRP